MKTVFIVAGTRPEVIKLFPVYQAFRNVKNVRVKWISTGQHRELLLPLYKFFGFKPNYDMRLMTQEQSLVQLSSRILETCADYFQKYRPHCVIVQGDTSTAAMASLAAFYLNMPVAHVEAGLRSFDIYAPYPEEVNRRVISLLSALHFAPTDESSRNLKRERVNGNIVVVGNTVVDSMKHAIGKIEKDKKFRRV